MILIFWEGMGGRPLQDLGITRDWPAILISGFWKIESQDLGGFGRIHMTKCFKNFSCRENLKYWYNTLGPLCLWQCFAHISICSMILWRKLAVFATLSSPGFGFNCFSDGNGWRTIGGCHADDYSMPSTATVNIMLRFIITVLIITGFAKISAKFINFGTEAILPSEIELTASIESAIGVG